LPGPGGVALSWMGAAGWFYNVQYSDNLTDWHALANGSGLPGVDAVMSCTDTSNTGLPFRIYRIVAY